MIKDPQTVEACLRASSPPRYMQRLREMEVEYEAHRRQLEAAHCSLREDCEGDPEAFSRRWRSQAQAWRFDRLNELTGEHNAGYPVEANLPMSPRTRDYVVVRGESYRRTELGPEWILEHFPPRPCLSWERPDIPRQVPRAPLQEQARRSNGQRPKTSRM